MPPSRERQGFNKSSSYPRARAQLPSRLPGFLGHVLSFPLAHPASNAFDACTRSVAYPEELGCAAFGGEMRCSGPDLPIIDTLGNTLLDGGRIQNWVAEGGGAAAAKTGRNLHVAGPSPGATNTDGGRQPIIPSHFDLVVKSQRRVRPCQSHRTSRGVTTANTAEWQGAGPPNRSPGGW